MNRIAHPLYPTRTETVHSLTDLCRQGTPSEVLAAINSGKKPDAQTLTEAFRRAKEAFSHCNSRPEECYDEKLAGEFYRWENVLNKLIEKGAKGSSDAMGHAYMIGRGWPQMLQK